MKGEEHVYYHETGCAAKMLQLVLEDHIMQVLLLNSDQERRLVASRDDVNNLHNVSVAFIDELAYFSDPFSL